MKLLVIATLSLFNIAQAASTLGRPIMYERMMDRAAAQPAPKHLCHNFEVITKDNLKSKKASIIKVNTDYFNAKVQCKYKCANEDEKSAELLEVFRPLNLSLYEGDGSSNEKIIWRSLGVTIKIWAKEQCYNKAKSECKNQVESITPQKISSGNWQWDTELNCNEKEIIYSPFDSRFQLANNGQSNYKPFSANPFSPTMTPDRPANELQEFIKDESETKLQEFVNNSECKKNIKIHSCFGDCVWEAQDKSKTWSETLSTTEHLGTDDFTICADKFLEQIKDKNYSRNIRTFKCEKYVWEFMRKTEVMGSSCAALRVESNCDKI